MSVLCIFCFTNGKLFIHVIATVFMNATFGYSKAVSIALMQQPIDLPKAMACFTFDSASSCCPTSRLLIAASSVLRHNQFYTLSNCYGIDDQCLEKYFTAFDEHPPSAMSDVNMKLPYQHPSLVIPGTRTQTCSAARPPELCI